MSGCEGTYVPQHVCGGHRRTMDWSSLCTLYDIASLLCVTVSPRLAGLQASGDSSVSAFSLAAGVLGLQTSITISLYVGFEDSNSGPHSKYLITRPSSQLPGANISFSF